MQSDIWSAGVILYVMLSGYPPFFANSDAEIFKKVLIGNFSFRGHEWRQVSACGKDLIRNMLIANTDLRLSAEQVLEHPWLRTNEVLLKVPIFPQRLVQYTNSTKFRKAVLLCIASQCDDLEIQQIRESFLNVDREAKGKIQVQNFLEAMSATQTFDQEILIKFINAMDLNSNGSIEYSEFIAATINSDIFLDRNRLLAAFQIFDRDENGKVSVDDLQRLLGKVDKKKQGKCEEVLVEINSPNGLNFEEFVQVITSNKLQSSS